jgi:hypothetical protein
VFYRGEPRERAGRRRTTMTKKVKKGPTRAVERRSGARTGPDKGKGARVAPRAFKASVDKGTEVPAAGKPKKARKVAKTYPCTTCGEELAINEVERCAACLKRAKRIDIHAAPPNRVKPLRGAPEELDKLVRRVDKNVWEMDAEIIVEVAIDVTNGRFVVTTTSRKGTDTEGAKEAVKKSLRMWIVKERLARNINKECAHLSTWHVKSKRTAPDGSTYNELLCGRCGHTVQSLAA